jgi:F0F1-type ATP synthase membrane subunit b/b'
MASGERATLERLRGDEDALEREIAGARADAAAMIEQARREAERLVADTRREAEREAERLRASAAEELEAARAGAKAELAASADELGRRATTNVDRAVVRAMEVVLGAEGGGSHG